VRRDVLLAGAIGVLVLTLAVGAIAVPGALTDPSEDVRESRLTMEQPYVEATATRGETVTLSLSSRLAHRGGPAANVTIETRAVNTDTGLVTTTERQSLGDITGDRDVPFTTNLTVPRSGGYRIETTVYANERRATSHQGTISSLDALEPPAAQSSVSFHEFENENTPLDAISYRISAVSDNESTLNVTTYLTNTGDQAAGGLELRLRARQGDSNVIADESTVRVGQIQPGRTRSVSTELTVPDGYDYWLDGILSSDGVIVATESSVADLDPTETLAVNQTRQETGFQSRDFAEQTESMEEARDRRAESTAAASGPGFTAVIAVVALLAVALVLRRRQP